MPSNASDPIAAAYLLQILEKEGISHDAAIKHLVAHSGSFKCPRLGILIRGVVAAQRHRKTGPSQKRHVRKVLVAFFHHLPRDRPGAITREDVLAFLARWDDDAVKTWNESFSYVNSIFTLAVKRGWLVASPCASIQRKPREKHRPPPATLDPMNTLRLLRWLQENAPQWVRYFAVCLFAGIRPDVREGEANRLDEDSCRCVRPQIGYQAGLLGLASLGETRLDLPARNMTMATSSIPLSSTLSLWDS